MAISQMNQEQLDRAVQILLADGLVVIPTETVYGLAGLATSCRAVDEIYRVKGRPTDNPLICHFASVEQLDQYVDLSDVERALFQHFSPGPLTIVVSPHTHSPIAPAMAGQSKVACRIPANDVARELISIVDAPLAAPSANPSGKPSSTSRDMATYYYQQHEIPTLEDETSVVGLESTIIEVTGETISILRPGTIGETELNAFLSDRGLPHIVISPTSSDRVTPGQKYRHYSPEIPVVPVDSLEDLDETKPFVVLTPKNRIPDDLAKEKWIELAEDPDEVAKDLYRIMFDLDKTGADVAYWFHPTVETDPSSVAVALRDRLAKIFGKL